eukprot:1827131-Rhodomonas_salina.1
MSLPNLQVTPQEQDVPNFENHVVTVQCSAAADESDEQGCVFVRHSDPPFKAQKDPRGYGL